MKNVFLALALLSISYAVVASEPNALKQAIDKKYCSDNTTDAA